MPADLKDLAPIVLDIGKLIGLVTASNEVNTGWFGDPVRYLSQIPTTRHAEIIALLRRLLGSTSAQVVGMPGGARPQEEWFPLHESTDRSAGIYLVLRGVKSPPPDKLEFGVGFKWTPGVRNPRAAVWLHLPLLSFGVSISRLLGTSAGPIRLAAELIPAAPVGTAVLKFSGVRLTTEVFLENTQPKVALVLTDVEIPGQPKADRALLQLTGALETDDMRGLIDMTVAVLVAELGTLCAGDPALAAHLPFLLGLDGAPRLELERLVDDGAAVFTRWLRTLTGSPTLAATWAAHLVALIQGNPDMPILGYDASPSASPAGTRGDPWTQALSLAGLDMVLTLAREPAAGGELLYPGLRIASSGVNIGLATRCEFEAALELAAIPLSGPATPRALPAFQVGVRLLGADRPLVEHTFTGSHEFAPLGTFKVRDLRAGLRLHADGLLPLFELRQVESELGSWPRVDLDNLDAVLQGLGGAAGEAIVQGLLKQLGAAGAGPGSRVAALLGLQAPASAPQWPVARPPVAAVLEDPIAAIAGYHAAAIATAYAGVPAWRVLLGELAALLVAGAVTGAGSLADPWIVPLVGDPTGAADLVVSAVASAPCRLRVALRLQPSATALADGASLALRCILDVLELELPRTPGSQPRATWLPGGAVRLRLAGAAPLSLPERAGIAVQLDAAALEFGWRRNDPAVWSAWLDNPLVVVAGVPQPLPNPLRFDPSTGLPAPDLAGLAGPLRFTLGRYLLESGPFGLGLAALCGLLPDLAGLQLGPNQPALMKSPLRLPPDWPTLANPGAAVFADPWPVVRDQLRKLVRNPAWTLPALRWLGGALADPRRLDAGAIGLPDVTAVNLAMPSLALARLPLASVPLPDFGLVDLGWSRTDWQQPFEIAGRGTLDDPWSLTLARTPARTLHGLAWLEPAGPPRGQILDALLALLPDNLRALADAAGKNTLGVAQLLQLLRIVAAADADLQTTLQAVPLADIEAGLLALQTFLGGSDGVVPLASQRPVAPGWDLGPPATAAHWDQLATPQVIQQVVARLAETTALGPCAVLFIGAPWADAAAWSPVLSALGAASTANHHFQLHAPGTDPQRFDHTRVTRDANGPVYFTATLALANLAPEVPANDRAIPLSAPLERPSQARQVLDIVARVAALTGDRPVILVAHSAAGLAARAAVALDRTRIKDLVTIGTPHSGGAAPWLAASPLAQALRLLDRLDPALVASPALALMLALLRGLPVQGAALPAACFVPPSPPSLPPGFKALAIATTLPALDLRRDLDTWLSGKIASLRKPANDQPAPTHLGVGVRMNIPTVVANGVAVESSTRLDIARLALQGDLVVPIDAPPVPRLAARVVVSRPGGYIVGSAASPVRLRWATLGIDLVGGLDGLDVRPVIRLHDGALGGDDVPLVTLARQDEGFTAPPLLAPLLATLVRVLADHPTIDALTRGLRGLGLIATNAPDLSSDGFAGLLARPWPYLQSRIAAALVEPTLRAALRAASRTVLGLDPDPLTSDEVRLVLTALGLATGPVDAPVPDPSALLRLLAAPGSALASLATATLADEGRRLALLQRLRTTFRLDDVFVRLGTERLGPFTGQAASTGRLTLGLAPDAVRLGDRISVAAALGLDLATRTVALSVELRPDRLPAAVLVTRTITLAAGQPPIDGGMRVELALGDENTGRTPVRLHPPPADPAQLGKLALGFTLSSLLGAAFTHFAARQHPGALLVLRQLDLVDQVAPDAPIRLRSLGPLLTDSASHLRRVFADDGPGSLAGLVAALGRLQNAQDSSLPLPWGVVVTASAVDGCTTLRLRKPAPPNATPPQIDLDLDLTLAADAEPVPGAALTLRLVGVAPGWTPLIVRAGHRDGRTRLSLGTTGASIDLLPFTGWSAALTQAAQIGVYKVLPTLTRALLAALHVKDPGVARGIDTLGQALGLQPQSFALDEDVLTQLRSDPIAWLKHHLGDAATMAAAYDLLAPLGEQLVLTDGLLSYGVGDLMGFALGRSYEPESGQDEIGARLIVPTLALANAFELRLGTRVVVTDDSNAPQLHIDAFLGLAGDTLVVAGIPLVIGIEVFHTPADGLSASLAVNIIDATLPNLRMRLYPADGPDNTLDPAAIFTLVRAILVPFALAPLLRAADVQNFLDDVITLANRPIKPGEILTSGGLLTKHDGVYALAPLRASEPRVLASNLLFAALQRLAGVNLDLAGAGSLTLFNVSDRVGLQVLIPQLRLGNDPEVTLVLGDPVQWPGSSAVGLAVSFAHHNGDLDLTNIKLELGNVGVDVRGRNRGQLFDLDGLGLDGFAARVRVAVTVGAGPTMVEWAAFTRLLELGLPLGKGSGNNPVVRSLLAPSGGEQTAINPAFDVGIGYRRPEGLSVQLGDDGKNEVWFPVQRSFGPLHVQQVGVAWAQLPKTLELKLDGGASLAGLAVEFDDLAVTIPVTDPFSFKKWGLKLKGLGVGYTHGPVRIAGALLDASTDTTTQYLGGFVAEAMGFGLTGFGSYAEVQANPGGSFTAMFVYMYLKAALGGPPFFFVTGLAAGFGYNMALQVPSIDQIGKFPLVAAAKGDPDTSIATAPLTALSKLQAATPIQRGSHWLAAGVKFNSFQLIDSFALLYVLFGDGFEVGLLGLSRLDLPRGAPLVSIEMALKAVFSPRRGLLSVEAQLTDASWLFGPTCRLTGGFAFYAWFAGERSGDFVVTLGGYHPRFAVPAHYPSVPRLGFNWRVGDQLTVKGESYFALTPSCVMAGGLLEAVFEAGKLRAWFKAWADFLIAWRPFRYDIEIGLAVGIKYGGFGIELSCRLAVWGPEFSGLVEVDWYILSFTIPIGANAPRGAVPGITWPEFRAQFLPADDELVRLDATRGLLAVQNPDVPALRTLQLHPEFVLRTGSALPANALSLNGADYSAPAPDDALSPLPLTRLGDAARLDLDIRPLPLDDVTICHRVALTRAGVPVPLPTSAVTLLYDRVPAALWDHTSQDTKIEARTVPALVGVELSVAAKPGPATAPILLNQWDDGPRHRNPLTYPRPLPVGPVDLLATFAVTRADAVFSAASRLLSGAGFQGRRAAVLANARAAGVVVPASPALAASSARLARRRTAPPEILSLDDGVIAQDADGSALIVAYRTPTVTPRRLVSPSLRAVLQRTAAPSRTQAPSLRTSAASVAGVTDATPRRSIAAPARTPFAASTLLRSAPPRASVPTRQAASARRVVLDTTTRASHRAELQRIQTVSVRAQPIDPTALIAGANATTIAAGVTQVWDLPGRARVTVTVAFKGDQGLRITALDRAGQVLADVETAGTGLLALPAATARVAVGGLGRVPDATSATPLLGNLSLRHAAAGPAVVGWQSDSEVVAVADATYLAHGAVLRTERPSSRTRTLLGPTRASAALRDQIALETSLAPRSETLAVIVERLDPAQTMILSNGTRMSVRGARLAAEPVRLAHQTRAILLYAVLGLDPGAAAITVAMSVNPGWRVAGVLGMAGTPARWAQALAQDPRERLVDDGPFSPHGQTAVAFTVK